MVKISVVTPTIRPKGLAIVQRALKDQTFTDFEWLTEVSVHTGDGSDFNHAMNKMLKRAQGELIVSLQDYIHIEKDGLRRFWDAYQENKNTFFTAPVGKTLNWKDISWDWREHKDAKVHWNAWEIDWACAPKEALYACGGFDESLDQYWGFDNVIVGLVADLKGYTFKNLYDNKAVAYDHDKIMPHPYRHTHRNTDFFNNRVREIRMGKRYDYLI